LKESFEAYTPVLDELGPKVPTEIFFVRQSWPINLLVVFILHQALTQAEKVAEAPLNLMHFFISEVLPSCFNHVHGVPVVASEVNRTINILCSTDADFQILFHKLRAEMTQARHLWRW
jgi:hypothetical protein